MIPVTVYRVGLAETIPQGRLRVSRRYLGRQLRARNWRAIRNHLKGFRAEHEGCPHSAGSAWFSERAAVRRAARLCQAAG